MSILNWLALALSVVLWIIQLYIGHGIGMASSAPIREGSAEDIYLNRLEAVRGILFLGSLLTFITQLIDNALVKNIGLIILAISLLSLAVFWSGLLSYRLPKPDVSAEEQLAIRSRFEQRLTNEGWTTRKLNDNTVLWSRPEKPESPTNETKDT